MSRPMLLVAALALATVGNARGAASQHAGHPAGGEARPLGQDAFAVIADVVRLLEADPSTDWSLVDLERLRSHLADMHDVTIGARVIQLPVAGGIRADVTGPGGTRDAIRRMTRAHATLFDGTGPLAPYQVSYDEIADGARLTVTAREGADAALVAKIRGLGFIGVLTLGNHHQVHHVALARGTGH